MVASQQSLASQQELLLSCQEKQKTHDCKLCETNHQGATLGTFLTIPAQFLVGRAMSKNNKAILECEDRWGHVGGITQDDSASNSETR